MGIIEEGPAELFNIAFEFTGFFAGTTSPPPRYVFLSIIRLKYSKAELVPEISRKMGFLHFLLTLCDDFTQFRSTIEKSSCK